MSFVFDFQFQNVSKTNVHILYIMMRSKGRSSLCWIGNKSSKWHASKSQIKIDLYFVKKRFTSVSFLWIIGCCIRSVENKEQSNWIWKSYWTQVLGRRFDPSQKSKKLSHHFWVCFELGIGILNVPRKIFLVVYEPILKLQGLVAVEFQGKNCFKKMASNFSEIDCGFR